MRLPPVPLASALLVMVSLHATAFESAGYRSGMSLADVTDVARRSGWDLTSISFLGPSGNGSYIQHRQLRSGDIEYGMDFSFCNDRLMLLGEKVNGGFDSFAGRIDSFTKRLGQGRVSSRSENDQSGTLSEVTVDWLDRENDRYRVSMIAFQGQQTVSVSILSPSIASPCRKPD
jgi:hypothetical protein